MYRSATEPASGGGRQDSRTRELILPKRMMWTSASTDQASVAGADILLAPKFGQVPEGVFLAGSGCRLENRGAPAALLLDVGRELHGGLRLAAGEPSARDVKVRVRFGESASEAMAELGERGAGNDHAIRNSVIDILDMGATSFWEDFNLDWAEGCFPTPLGILHVRHERTSGGRVSSAVTAPDGMHFLTETINPMEDLS